MQIRAYKFMLTDHYLMGINFFLFGGSQKTDHLREETADTSYIDLYMPKNLWTDSVTYNGLNLQIIYI